MRYPSRAAPPDSAIVVEAPTHCPTCRSKDITAGEKVVTPDTYWRCGSCGDLWNIGRHRHADRYLGRRPAGR